ncbi:hypothetical protein OAT67_02525 [Bacteriovoracaceae bacterium]|nr:hypothetical protein [Bacteriovoracaceae bacterium]
MRVCIVFILLGFLVSSCETPAGFSAPSNKYRFIGPPGKGYKVKRRSKPSEDTFEADFTRRTIEVGLSGAVNEAVTAKSGSTICHQIALTSYTLAELKDNTEIDQMILDAYNGDNSCKTVYTGNSGNTTSAGGPYAKTLAYSMIQDMCNPESSNIGSMLSEPSLGSYDAMSLSLFNKGMKPEKSIDNLATTYALMYGLGQRESDGNLKEGRDTSANNKSAVTEEAGLFQVSANSLNLGQKKAKTKNFLR